MDEVQNHELKLASDFVQSTNRNVFLTGRAGTGKTTFLNNLKGSSPKRMIVVAPTGVAAINAGGVTIHSFFQLPFHPHIPTLYLKTGSPSPIESTAFRVSREKLGIIRTLDLLVIDEISMVRADLLDAVDHVLRKFRNRNLPFGGLQLLMIGDLQQLAPVVTEEDREILDEYYDTAFFFGSHALRNTDFITIELQHVYRQRDASFIRLLNRVRENSLDQESLQELNKRYVPKFLPGEKEGYITLTTHNTQAEAINSGRLGNLPGDTRVFKAVIVDEFPEYAYPTASELVLKKGAQVMFVKNDLSGDKLYYNGKIGRVLALGEESVLVLCPGDPSPVSVEPVEWQNMKYTLDKESGEIREIVIGTFTQYPLKLAWAITIHKSQGLTFDHAVIDAHAAFAHGQVYVALSRCRTLEGIVLSTPLGRQGLFTDPAVAGFTRNIERNRPGTADLQRSRKAFQELLITELFDFEPLLRITSFALKLVKDHHRTLAGNLPGELEDMSERIRADLSGVSVKFGHQLGRLLPGAENAETHGELQDRIKKACAYFSGKISEIVTDRFEGLQWHTDNKEVRKSVNHDLEKIRIEASVKQACLQACSSGFQVKAYLDARARAALEPAPRKTVKVARLEDTSGTILHPELFNRLKSWRARKAMEKGQSHYMILHQKTLVTMVNSLPQTMAALKAVKGMGTRKADDLGPELLDIIGMYCRERNIPPPGAATGQPVAAP